MRPDSTDRKQQRPSTNGSSQNGSSPHTNGSTKSETNGYHTNGHAEVAVAVRNNEPFFGHDREEVTRILLQTLSDLGYRGAAEQLSRESGYELEIPSVAAFKHAVLHGEWEEAEALLLGTEASETDGGVPLGNGHSNASPSWRKANRLSIGSQNGLSRRGLPLADGADITCLKFLVRQQKYLELLEIRDVSSALNVLRNELTPLKTDTQRLHFLSSLVMCPSAEDLHAQAGWDGAQGESRSHLLSEISKSISPSVMIPEHRLATLLSAVQDEQILGCRYHNTTTPPSLYTDHECSSEDFPLHTLRELRQHSDEVWFLEFSHDGSMLATAGKDGLVTVYDTVRWRPINEFREHDRSPTGGSSDSARENKGICYVAFSPNDQHLISCSQNNEFVVVNVRTGQRVAHADHFDYPVTTAAWLPDSETFVVGTQSSRRPLGLYSLRGASSSQGSSVLRNPEIHTWRDPPWDHSRKEDQPSSFRIADCAVDATGLKLAATTVDNRIMLFSLDPAKRYRKEVEWGMENRLTSITFSADGDLLLVNMNEGRVLALDPETGEVVCKYEGAMQREFVIRSAFGGAGEAFVISGSEGKQ